MNESQITFKRSIFVAHLLVVHALAAAFLINQFVVPKIWLSGSVPVAISDPTNFPPVPTPLAAPDEFFDPPPNDPGNAAFKDPLVLVTEGNADSLSLIIPVTGITSEQLQDTFSQSRSEGRVHEAIDIVAPAGAPVIAAAEGRIVKFHDSERGGITIYQLSSDGKYVYYYAHLQRRADELKEGDVVRQGATLGFVGDTGNSGVGNYHLHFSLFAVTDPKRYWDGTNINPYPLLRKSGR